jgi:hypothetical protein
LLFGGQILLKGSRILALDAHEPSATTSAATAVDLTIVNRFTALALLSEQ